MCSSPGNTSPTPSPPQLSVVRCVGWRPPGLAPIYFGIWADMLVWLYGCSLWYRHETQFYSRLPDPLAFTVFLPPFLQGFLSLRFRSCIVDVANGTGFCTLQFDWLHFSIVVSICWKEKYPRWEWRTARMRTVFIKTRVYRLLLGIELV